MKQNLFISLRITVVLLVLCCILYPALILLPARVMPGGGEGRKLELPGKKSMYVQIGQAFTSDSYFQGRPSAVGYNAAGSGGSNKGASNPDYLKTVNNRIDSFLVHNPGLQRSQIPAELVTASGSGLDPHISPAAARIQVPRIAAIRHLEERQLFHLIDSLTEKPFAGLMGPAVINVLELNLATDAVTVKTAGN